MFIKKLLKKSLSARLQYNLWFLVFILLTVPFLPFRLRGIPQIISRIAVSDGGAFSSAASRRAAGIALQNVSSDWLGDFAISVNRGNPSLFGRIFLIIWIAGMLTMMILMTKSGLRLYRIEKSALPLQNQKVHQLFDACCREMHLGNNIALYSTAFFKSPVMLGILRPRIYIPLHLISDFRAKDMRYILLHELQHYRYRDALVNCLMNLAKILYWFNPLVWCALKQMRNEREIACDSSVLELLEKREYKDYGNTLLNFAEKISLSHFPFVSGISSSLKQMRKRIINIAAYQPQSFRKKRRGLALYLLIAFIVFGLAPALSVRASADEYRPSDVTEKEETKALNLSSYFSGYRGSFVLYDASADNWQIYNEDYAALRVSPDSTYKIYAALNGLESEVITPEQSSIAWDKEIYPYEAWNADQDLDSAMQNSVNWYFQSIDEEIGKDSVKNYIQKIGYGNENVSGDLSSYWLESSLKISPVEQVELLTKFYNNEFQLKQENIDAVKASLLLYSSADGSFYGKTGTGRVNGQDINGWFIGFIENGSHTYFFATNIQGASGAAGSKAAEITFSILSDLYIWNQ